jgi:hypothetical protein
MARRKTVPSDLDAVGIRLINAKCGIEAHGITTMIAALGIPNRAGMYSWGGYADLAERTGINVQAIIAGIREASGAGVVYFDSRHIAISRIYACRATTAMRVEGQLEALENASQLPGGSITAGFLAADILHFVDVCNRRSLTDGKNRKSNVRKPHDITTDQIERLENVKDKSFALLANIIGSNSEQGYMMLPAAAQGQRQTYPEGDVPRIPATSDVSQGQRQTLPEGDVPRIPATSDVSQGQRQTYPGNVRRIPGATSDVSREQRQTSPESPPIPPPIKKTKNQGRDASAFEENISPLFFSQEGRGCGGREGEDDSASTEPARRRKSPHKPRSRPAPCHTSPEGEISSQDGRQEVSGGSEDNPNPKNRPASSRRRRKSADHIGPARASSTDDLSELSECGVIGVDYPELPKAIDKKLLRKALQAKLEERHASGNSWSNSQALAAYAIVEEMVPVIGGSATVRQINYSTQGGYNIITMPPDDVINEIRASLNRKSKSNRTKNRNARS